MGQLANFRPSTHGLHYANSWPDVPDVEVDTPFGSIGLGHASNGLCGGMVFAVRDLFEAQRPPPTDTANPGPDSPAFHFIVKRLFDSFDLPEGVAQFFEWMNLPDHNVLFGLAGTSTKTIDDSLPALRSCIDGGRPCPLGLVRAASRNPADLGQNHQVLAYGYEDHDATTTVAVYDCNLPDRDDVTITFDHTDPRHGIHFAYTDGGPIRGFFPMDYTSEDPADLFSPH